MSREVPDGWSSIRLGHYVEMFTKLNVFGDLTPLSVTKHDGIVLQSDKFNKRIAVANTSKYKVIQRGEFAYDPMSLYYGAMGRLECCDMGIISPAYITFRVKHGLDAKYFLYLSQTDDFNRQVNRETTGGNQAGKRKKTDWKGFCSIPLVIPPLTEQRQITDILSSVDEVIQATQAVVEQTRTVKQGVLQRLLTKGIGHTRFKQTKIGELPEGWEVRSVADVASRVDSGWSPDCEATSAGDGEWAILRTSSVVWEGFRPHENKRLPSHFQPRPEIEVKRGDVLVTRAGPAERTGVVSFVNKTQARLMLSDKLIRIQTISDICDPQFLSLILSSQEAQSQIMQKKSGMALSQTNISQKTLKELCFGLPPRAEQESIVRSISSISEAAERAGNQLRSMRTCKEALMSDLLTGRVRTLTGLPMAAE